MAEITVDEARATYACLRAEMAAAYAKAGLGKVAGYQQWANVALAPYQSATHGSRYVNNYANAVGAESYARFEEVGTMPAGSVLAKDSFVVRPDGRVAVGPLFVMEKTAPGASAATGDWRYTMIMADGSVFGTTGGAGSARMEFCAECHSVVADDQDSLFFLPEPLRAKLR
ncbi:MAG: cytochrome P460 family protein [Rhodospirillales bacterium]